VLAERRGSDFFSSLREAVPGAGVTVGRAAGVAVGTVLAIVPWPFFLALPDVVFVAPLVATCVCASALALTRNDKLSERLMMLSLPTKLARF
jgi:acyl-CoA reductase-like NAD-dependent aldehyde dehydrogenase